MSPTTPSVTPTRDPDLVNAGAALRRAARKAREFAKQTGTPCYVWRDGRVVNIGVHVPAMPRPAG